ncbi:unnamed protein product [Acanthoscelides obtectus]|uniref:Uncharacterized protein n=1 Tax=Acanthoscelides obtectus TaxID=200917 RepID=A0A9P0LAP0_ACAOB|nr:unnamed protein product [Acanthoscelides obtectus]CAK1643231.1 hypothetical protein AOBTE_LOCUS13457 [Acanthoscelides obtectus]
MTLGNQPSAPGENQKVTRKRRETARHWIPNSA